MNLEVIDALHILVHELYECAVARGTANGESADFGARGQEKELLHGRSLHIYLLICELIDQHMSP